MNTSPSRSPLSTDHSVGLLDEDTPEALREEESFTPDEILPLNASSRLPVARVTVEENQNSPQLSNRSLQDVAK